MTSTPVPHRLHRLSTPLLAVLLVLGLAVLGVLGGASSATALPPIPPTFSTPQILLTLTSTSMSVGDHYTLLLRARTAEGAPLVGTLKLTQTRPGQSGVLVNDDAAKYQTTASYDLVATGPADFVWTAVYTPATGTFGIGASAHVAFSTRFPGTPTVAATVVKGVAGTPATATAIVRVPGTDPAQPGGRIGLRLDGSGSEIASCLPQHAATSPAGIATCEVAVGTLSAGTHSLVASYSASPLYRDASGSRTFTVAAAPKAASKPAPAPGATSGASSAAPAPNAGPGTDASAVPGTPVTPDAAAPGSPATADAVSAPRETTTATAQALPMWVPIALAVLAVLLLASLTVTAVVIARSRRDRSGA